MGSFHCNCSICRYIPLFLLYIFCNIYMAWSLLSSELTKAGPLPVHTPTQISSKSNIKATCIYLILAIFLIVHNVLIFVFFYWNPMLHLNYLHGMWWQLIILHHTNINSSREGGLTQPSIFCYWCLSSFYGSDPK